MDGTFKKCPGIFSQIYTIHFLLGNKVIPAAYCFLPDKTRITYTRMFNELIRFSGLLTTATLNPRSISCDFELGLINAVKELFPQCEIRGCLFHLNQSVFRKLQSLGLSTLYFNDKKFAKSIRRINALPLLPIYLINDTFENLSDEIRTECNENTEIDSINQLINYYYETYVKDGAVFPKEQWNQYRELRRTNNEVEGFYKKFDQLFNTDHPQFYDVINKIKGIQEENERTFNDLKERGFFEPKKVDRYSKLNDQLVELWDELDNENITPLNFLSAAQYLLSNKK